MSEETNILYDKVLMNFTGHIKHFFKNSFYHFYLLKQFIVLSQKPLEPEPKYVFRIDLSTYIGWKVCSKNIVEFKCLIFKSKNKYKEFYADPKELYILWNQLKCRVTFGKIADFYEPQFILGKGSSARVLMIQSLFEDKKKYAAKSIDKSYIEKSENGLEAFKTEVKIMKDLSSYNNTQQLFLNLFEVFEGEMTYYLIIDLIEGKTLQEELENIKNKREKLHISNVKIIMQKLLTGVDIMHKNGIIHRDLKPDNIMFSQAKQFETLKIVDFGLATETNVKKYMFPKCGTPGYVAPEILNLQDRTFKYQPVCDIFSCGCILYKLLTGSSLFPGNQFNEVLKQNKACDIDLKIKIKDIPPCLIEILTFMLEKNPLKRLNADQLLKLKFFSDDQKIESFSLGTQEDKEKTEQRQEQELRHPSLSTDKNIPQQLSIRNDSPFLRNLLMKNNHLTLPQVNECFQQFEASVNSVEDIEEMHEAKQYIQQLPSRLKKPSFVKAQQQICSVKKINIASQKSLEFAINNQGAYVKLSSKNSFNSFYMKDPLYGLKNNKEYYKQQTLQQQTTHQKIDSQQQMKRILLFDRTENERKEQNDKKKQIQQDFN